MSKESGTICTNYKVSGFYKDYFSDTKILQNLTFVNTYVSKSVLFFTFFYFFYSFISVEMLFALFAAGIEAKIPILSTVMITVTKSYQRISAG
jgi:hypothetical protein